MGPLIMRISEHDLCAIRRSALQYFGSGVQVWLFGSRLDDQKKGGDIDLYIETGIQDADRLIDAKLHFLRELHQALGEQKIDVVIKRTAAATHLPIYTRAKKRRNGSI